jgi:spermidine/putrescine transport system permease protein
MTAAASLSQFATVPLKKRHASRWLQAVGRHGLTLLALFCIVYLLAPIVMMIVLSFNKTVGRFDYVWNSFAIDAWLKPFAIDGLADSLEISIVLAFVVASLATMIGTGMAYAQVRYNFIGQRLLDIILLLTIATPEVIAGSALLKVFLDLRLPLGPVTILLSHIMFDIAFVAIVVKSRLRGFDIVLEQAAMDLGARGPRVFRLITLPLILPAVVTAWLLAFMLSLDDFIITNFVSGATVTFPLFVWGTARVAMPPQIYVIGTAIFVLLSMLLLGSFLLERRRARLRAIG